MLKTFVKFNTSNIEKCNSKYSTASLRCKHLITLLSKLKLSSPAYVGDFNMLKNYVICLVELKEMYLKLS